ncbi:unnamed protein product [Peronospora belbahrii]|uniref:Abnormal spindle-like microcephaly-associated protein ASH domain-containing protein n=1 Tax=Peronospora belbahrii TaxID=622444 RepID=A0ABN8CU86_9STRA|nr:unnamed protein product [Peronospora belbahrii]
MEKISTNQEDDGKENRIPSSSFTSSYSNVRTRHRMGQIFFGTEPLPSSLHSESSMSSLRLGKRPKPMKLSSDRDDVCDTLDASKESDRNQDQCTRDSVVKAHNLMHFEARALKLHDSCLGRELPENNKALDDSDPVPTMFVDVSNQIGQLYFGTVALGERKSRRLRLKNTSEWSNARVKYEGYTMGRDGYNSASSTVAAPMKTRFKCDLHLCVINSLKAVTLRVTFEPLPTDVGRLVTATLKFTVNDQFKLECRAIGTVTPHLPQLSRFKRMRRSKHVDTVALRASRKQNLLSSTFTMNTRQTKSRTLSEPNSTMFSISSALTLSDLEPELEPVVTTGAKVGENAARQWPLSSPHHEME